MKAYYRCRMCGKLYSDGTTGNANIVINRMLTLQTKNSASDNDIPIMIRDVHWCNGDDSQFGMADFIGFK